MNPINSVSIQDTSHKKIFLKTDHTTTGMIAVPTILLFFFLKNFLVTLFSFSQWLFGNISLKKVKILLVLS